MKVGVPKETASGERRVALVPDSTKRLAEAGVEVLVESGAGTEAGFLDSAYEETGTQIVGDAFARTLTVTVPSVQRGSPAPAVVPSSQVV